MCCEAAHDGDIFHVSGEHEAGRAGRALRLPRLPALPSQAARGWLRCQLQGVQGPSPGPALCSSCVLAPSRCPECGHCCAPQEQRVLWWGGEGFLSGDIHTRGCCGHTRSCSSHCALPACGVRALIPEIVQHFWIFISMWYAG